MTVVGWDTSIYNLQDGFGVLIPPLITFVGAYLLPMGNSIGKPVYSAQAIPFLVAFAFPFSISISTPVLVSLAITSFPGIGVLGVELMSHYQRADAVSYARNAMIDETPEHILLTFRKIGALTRNDEYYLGR